MFNNSFTKTTTRILQAVVIVAVAVSLASAAEFYIRKDGSAAKADATGPATDNTKCMTVATHNAATFAAGDIVHISDLGGTVVGPITPPSNGGIGNPIIYQGAGGVDANITATTQGLGVTKHNLTIQNLIFTNGNYGIIVNGGDNITVNNASATNAGISGFYFNNTEGTVIDNLTSTGSTQQNFFIGASSIVTGTNLTSTDSDWTDNSVKHHGFMVANSSFTCTGCTADNNAGDGFNHTGTGTSTFTNCISSNNGNVGDDSAGDGFSPHDTAVMNVRYSISRNNRLTGVAMAGGSSGTVYNNVIAFNGSATTSRAGLIAMTADNTTGAWLVKNNLFIDNYPNELKFEAYSDGQVTRDNNRYYHTINDNVAVLDADPVTFLGTGLSWATYHTTQEYESASTYGDPLVTDSAAFNFIPVWASPLINAGVDVNLTTDYAGRLVPIGSAPDIGAYEFVPSAPTGRSTPSQVANCYGGSGTTYDRLRQFYSGMGYSGTLVDMEGQYTTALGCSTGTLTDRWVCVLGTTPTELNDAIRSRCGE